jgi:SAM-dependent methyltransferase
MPDAFTPTCRACGHPLSQTFVDLGLSPVSNDFRRPEDRDAPEMFYPLHVFVCDRCYLVQLPEVRAAEQLFTSDYAYFSAYSSSWLDHARRYAHAMIARFGLAAEDLVVEIASNDGYLLQYFKAEGIQVLGVDPAANVAREAEEIRGVTTLVRFFGEDAGRELRQQGRSPRLMVANNVLAHVPDINDFVAGFRELLAPDGVITFEFPHLLKLIEQNQFDTIYHEHYSYLSYLTVSRILDRTGLRGFDVERLPTHGGSIRLFVCHEASDHKQTQAILDLEREERGAGLADMTAYAEFGARAQRVKRELLSFLIGAKNEGKSVAAYGAPAKGNTLLNYCGIRTDLVDFTVDRNPHKQGRLLPGVGIPVLEPEEIRRRQPDYVLILPWNLTEEIVQQLGYVREYGGRFVTPIPELRVLS